MSAAFKHDHRPRAVADRRSPVEDAPESQDRAASWSEGGTVAAFPALLCLGIDLALFALAESSAQLRAYDSVYRKWLFVSC